MCEDDVLASSSLCYCTSCNELFPLVSRQLILGDLSLTCLSSPRCVPWMECLSFPSATTSVHQSSLLVLLFRPTESVLITYGILIDFLCQVTLLPSQPEEDWIPDISHIHLSESCGACPFPTESKSLKVFFFLFWIYFLENFSLAITSLMSSPKARQLCRVCILT